MVRRSEVSRSAARLRSGSKVSNGGLTTDGVTRLNSHGLQAGEVPLKSGREEISSNQLITSTVGDLRALAVRALQRMYQPDHGLFAFCLRRHSSGLRLEGVSRRYTATALIGLSGEPEDVADRVLRGKRLQDVCARLVLDLEDMDEVGEVALTLWAARMLDHPAVDKAATRLEALDPAHGDLPTVELAWCVTALCIGGICPKTDSLTEALALRLMKSYSDRSDLFSHWPIGAKQSWLRSHVTCFADWVYPVQALSHYFKASSNKDAAEMARRCARRMCDRQGAQGQWWWHYDVRTGRVVERFPVYSVHQDAMGPMALFDLEAACGDNYKSAIARSIQWLIDPPEMTDSLIDQGADVIWRKVARSEPGNSSRVLQALASRVHPAWRVPGVDVVFRPGRVDYESRPYHMGWILYAWSGERGRTLSACKEG